MEISNQYQMALWYLIKWESFSMKEVINDSLFYKFNTRLSEIEKEHGSITEKSRQKFKNRFGRKSSYVIYSCSNIERAKELIQTYQT